MVTEKINTWREELHAGGPGGDGPPPAPVAAPVKKTSASAPEVKVRTVRYMIEFKSAMPNAVRYFACMHISVIM